MQHITMIIGMDPSVVAKNLILPYFPKRMQDTRPTRRMDNLYWSLDFNDLCNEFLREFQPFFTELDKAPFGKVPSVSAAYGTFKPTFGAVAIEEIYSNRGKEYYWGSPHIYGIHLMRQIVIRESYENEGT